MVKMRTNLRVLRTLKELCTFEVVAPRLRFEARTEDGTIDLSNQFQLFRALPTRNELAIKAGINA
jgi:hypothetical protein